MSEGIPIDTEVFLNAELSFSESPKYSTLISPLSSRFKILVTIRSNAMPLHALRDVEINGGRLIELNDSGNR